MSSNKTQRSPTPVRLYREHQGLTQVKLAVEAGVDVKVVARAEFNETIDSITVGSLKKLAVRLNVTPSALLDRTITTIEGAKT